VREKALLVANNDSPETRNLAKVLRFFGITSRCQSTREFLTDENCRDSTALRLLCASDTFSEILAALEQKYEGRHLQDRIHSAFVYAGNDSEALQKLIRQLTGDNSDIICEADHGLGDVVVSDQLDEFCGVMAGLRATACNIAYADLVLNGSERKANSLISIGQGSTFLKLEYDSVAVFLSTAKEIIDIDAELTSQNFDVREHFLRAVPLVLYIKWAFAETCWTAPETNACLVIDDPVLKSTHGFVDFEELLCLMKRHNFSSNIAFIPWNWRRSSPEVSRLFRENTENYSVSVHGCDHTRAEFGSSDEQRLYWKAQQALERMKHHESITGIRHDRVMVFPQGIFSTAAVSALKHTDLIAAVNNDVISADPHPRAVILSELWDVAVMGYDAFPIFTRRYPWEGIENFAFDALLGKPAIIIIHHDYCSDRCSRLINFIERLNALKCELTWRSLGEVVRRSCRQRELSSDTAEIEMYAREVRIQNRSGHRKRFLVKRRECKPSAIREVQDDSGPIAWNALNGHIHFEIEVNSGESRTISMKYHKLAENGCNGDTLGYRFNAMLRRYLCEIRDNYVTPARLRLAALAKSD
jgi:hypothetical protein